MDAKYGKKIDMLALKKTTLKAESIKAARKETISPPPDSSVNKCPVCDSERNYFLQTIYNFHYCVCSDCGLAYVRNPPDRSMLEKIYNSQYYTNHVQQVVANDEINEFRIENVAKPKIDFILGNISTQKNTWLDVGCGIGEILNIVAKKGYICKGLETNRYLRGFGAKKFGLDIIDDYIDEKSISRYLHDWGIISLFNILEHIQDPASLVKTISRTQQAGDNIVIEVPHFPSISSFSQMAFPSHVNRNMFPPYHLYLFSLKSLEVILRRNFYEITNVWYFGQDFYEMFSTLSIVAGVPPDSMLAQKILLLMNDFQGTIDKNELCDAMLVIGVKTQQNDFYTCSHLLENDQIYKDRPW